MASQRGESLDSVKTPRKGLDKSHYLYIAVIRRRDPGRRRRPGVP
jgi:hypothetical protein